MRDASGPAGAPGRIVPLAALQAFPMATMNDVAKAANVSLTTVSHVLNGTRKVNAATAAAVREAIERTGYIPNTLARSLAKASSSTIGVAISALSNHYFADTVHAIEAECSKHGLMMVFADTHDDPRQELRAVMALHQRRVDGIVLAPAGQASEGALAYLRDNALPTVLVDRFQSDAFDQVGVENRAAMQEIVAHLVRHGHSRIGLVSGRPGLSTTQERIDGYRDGLAAAGLRFDAKLVASGQSDSGPAMEAAGRLLALKNRPTALISANNLMTIGTLRALKAHGLRLGQDVALIGFDDLDWADLAEPGLTLMAQPVHAIGAKAIELLLQRIAEPDAPPRTLRLAPQLNVRGSCGAHPPPRRARTAR